MGCIQTERKNCCLVQNRVLAQKRFSSCIKVSTSKATNLLFRLNPTNDQLSFVCENVHQMNTWSLKFLFQHVSLNNNLLPDFLYIEAKKKHSMIILISSTHFSYFKRVEISVNVYDWWTFSTERGIKYIRSTDTKKTLSVRRVALSFSGIFFTQV